MGKTKPSLKDRASQYVSDGLVREGNRLCCSACGISLVNEKFRIDQHLRTKKHRKSVELKAKLRTMPGVKLQNEFAKDLGMMMVECNIPLYKLNNPSFSNFLMKYTGRLLPSETTLRKNFVEECYDETMQNIRKGIGDCNIWASIAGTTDSTGRYIANVIVGALKPGSASKSYLIHSTILERTNQQTIARTLVDAFQLLWPDGIHHDRVFLLVTDAEPFMVEAGQQLTLLFTKMIHITCIVHALEWLVDTIRGKYKKADELMSCVKEIFFKSPSRVQRLKEMYEDLDLPPHPISTKCRTWLLAVVYYVTEWNRIKSVVLSMDDDAASLIQAKELFSDEETLQEMCAVHTHYSFLAAGIAQLEKSGQSLADSLKFLQSVLKNMAVTPDASIKTKLSNVLSKNTGLSALSAINANNLERIKSFEQLEEASPADILCYSYAPIVSCEVERSFSRFKLFLSNNRMKFKFDNLKHHIVINCNNFEDEWMSDEDD